MAYIDAIDAFKEANHRYPVSLDELETQFSEDIRKIRSHWDLTPQYRFINNTNSYELIVGDIIKDRRELVYQSDTKSWYFDS